MAIRISELVLEFPFDFVQHKTEENTSFFSCRHSFSQYFVGQSNALLFALPAGVEGAEGLGCCVLGLLSIPINVRQNRNI